MILGRKSEKKTIKKTAPAQMIGKERCDEPITEVWGADIVSFTNLLTYLPGILWASKRW